MAFWSKKGPTDASNGSGYDHKEDGVPKPVSLGQGNRPVIAGEAPPPERKQRLDEPGSAVLTSKPVRETDAVPLKSISAAFGDIIAVLLRSKGHQLLPLSYLASVVVPALTTNQFALAEARSTAQGFLAPVGVLIWASVSTDVDRQLTQSPDGVRKLKSQLWKSGEIIWIVEAVGHQDAIKGLLSEMLKTRWKGKQVRIREVNKAGESVARVLSG
jgi:hemolysin-activating ACP:hemolysin acyltransferase